MARKLVVSPNMKKTESTELVTSAHRTDSCRRKMPFPLQLSAVAGT